jgi:sigma-B regulation protein RsbU (phosphoserine phosphatase)
VTASALPDLIPADEDRRIEAVRRYDILDTPPDGTFDRITALAARMFRVPIAIVSVVDTDRIWFKSHHGLPDVEEIGRDPGLCASAILQHAPWVVADAAHDPRTLANPLVAGEFGLRFYAGVPLTTSDGHNLGTLCVIDTEPRLVAEEELANLQDLAALVMDELELRLAARRTVVTESSLRREAEQLADALQASLLPPRPPAVPGLDVATRYIPGERGMKVGGDFFDVFHLGHDDWAFVLGDACGKGARAAALTALARWTIRATAVHEFQPSAGLRDLNAVLLADDNDADDHFCSVVSARLQLKEGGGGAAVTFASGGHPLPILVRASGALEVRGEVVPPVGLFDGIEPSDEHVELGPGDTLVFYTDGITEARDAAGELFGDEGLHAVLAGCAASSAQETAARVVNAARQFAVGRLNDDAALLIVRVPSA